MRDVDGSRRELVLAAVTTRHRLADAVQCAHVEYKRRLVLEDLAAERAHHLYTEISQRQYM